MTGTITVGEGRRLAYDDAGRGAPVVLLHGSPGSRAFKPPSIDGIRLITFDRPGYGDSDPQPGRAVSATAPDAIALADALDLERFALLGWSGGGAFACATAFAYPDRITRLALVSSPGPLDEVPNGWDLLGDYQRPTAEMARLDPARSERSIARHMADYLAQPSAFLGSGRGPDGPVLNGPLRPMLDKQIALALRQGAAGLAADLVALWREWGFRLADIRVPTRVWHGALDRHNDAETATLAARIPGATRVVWPESGHLGLLEHSTEVMTWATGNGRRPT